MIRILTLLTLTLSMTNVWSQHLTGTGENFGSGWRADGQGGYIVTGKNFGQSWRSEGQGGYIGTGDNFGGVSVPTTGAVMSAAARISAAVDSPTIDSRS